MDLRAHLQRGFGSQAVAGQEIRYGDETLVHDKVLVLHLFVVELVNFSSKATDVCLAQPASEVSCEHLFHRLDRSCGPKLGGGAAWTPDSKWRETPGDTACNE